MKTSISAVLAVVTLLWSVPGFSQVMDTEQLKSSCQEKKTADACFELGEKYRVVEMDNKTALEYFLQGCELKHMTSCVHAGILTEVKGTQNSPEWKKAAELFETACNEHHDKGCFELGALKYREGRSKKATEYFKIACEYGNKIACNNMKKFEK
ncbi:MAG: sel1 repeat family protein [Nitrospinae bacterium]|nr:sel1 repeat family protein [Nitrospinota bacterium]